MSGVSVKNAIYVSERKFSTAVSLSGGSRRVGVSACRVMNAHGGRLSRQQSVDNLMQCSGDECAHRRDNLRAC